MSSHSKNDDELEHPRGLPILDEPPKRGGVRKLKVAGAEDGGFVLRPPTEDPESRGAQSRIGTLDPDSSESGERAAADRPEAGATRRLGRFSVLETLGRGGMGTVLEAYDDTLARTVALKLLHGHVSEVRQGRLLREAQALAQLSHPNVVQVYEVGMVEGRMFIAMELIEGETLREWQRTRRSWKEVIDIYLQAGRGLAAAHLQGLIHRDFKPENCMLSNDGRVCVLDFGLARGQQSVEDSTQPTSRPESLTHSSLVRRLTQSGRVLGTLCYLPLVQMTGLPADEKSDQFSFCVSMYEALYGMLPFRSESVSTLIDAQQYGEFQPVPRGSRVPRRLRRILLRGLATQPENRWPSMDALLVALRRVRHPRRRRVAAVASTLIAGFGAGALAVSMRDEPCANPVSGLEGAWSTADKVTVRGAFTGSGHPDASLLLERIEGRIDDYTQRWITMYEESCRASLLRSPEQPRADPAMACLRRHRDRLRATIDVLAGVSTASDALESMVLPFKLPVLESCIEPTKTHDAEPLDAEVNEQVAALRREIDYANTRGAVGELDTAIDLAKVVVAGARRLEHPPLLAEALETLGRFQAMGPAADEAELTLQQGIQAAAKAHDDSMAARAWTSLLHALLMQDDLERAVSLAFAATAAVDRAGDEVARAWLLNNLGSIHGQRGDYARACELLEQALSVKQEIFGPTHIDVGVAWFNLGNALKGDARPQEARHAFEQARTIMLDTVGGSHHFVASAEIGLGHLSVEAHRLAEAAEHHQRALKIREGAFGPDDLSVGKSLEYLGKVRMKQRRWRDAAKRLTRALKIYDHELGPNSLQSGVCATYLATVEWARGHRQDARTLASRAVALLEVGGRPEERAAAQFMLARSLYDQPDQRVHARTLAQTARDLLAEEERSEVDAWLSKHPLPRRDEESLEVTGSGESITAPSPARQPT